MRLIGMRKLKKRSTEPNSWQFLRSALMEAGHALFNLVIAKNSTFTLDRCLIRSICGIYSPITASPLPFSGLNVFPEVVKLWSAAQGKGGTPDRPSERGGGRTTHVRTRPEKDRLSGENRRTSRP